MSQQKNKNDGQKTVKTAALNTVANAAALAAGIIVMPILARVITQEDLGIASTFVANRNILVIIATLAIYAFVNKAMLEFSHDKPGYIKSIVLYCIVGLVLVFVITLPLKPYIQEFLSLDDFLYYWLFASMLAFSLYMIADYYCIFHNFAKTVFMIAILTGPVAQILSVLIAIAMPSEKYIGRVVGLDIIYMLVSIVLLAWVFIKMRNARAKKAYIASSLRFSVPLIPHLLSQMVLTQCDLVMITAMVGADASGIYSMAHTIGFLAFTVMTQIMAAWSPWVYRRLEEKNFNPVRSNFKLVMLLGFVLSIGLLTISPEVIDIFLPESYEATKYIIPALVVAMFMQFCYLFFYDVEYYHKKTALIAAASIIAAVVNLILNLILIPKFGFFAACYTTLFSYFVLFFLNYLFSRKLGANKIYDIRFFFVVILFMLIYMIAMLFLVHQAVVRYILFVVIAGIVIVKYRKGFIAVIHALRPHPKAQELTTEKERQADGQS